MPKSDVRAFQINTCSNVWGQTKKSWQQGMTDSPTNLVGGKAKNAQ